MWEKIGNLVLKNRKLIFFMVGVLTILFAWFSLKVKIAYNDMKVLPGTDSASTYYSKFKRQFGEDGSIMVLGVKDPKIRTFSFLQNWASLTTNIGKLSGITNSLSITNLLVLKKDTLHEKFIMDRISPKVIRNQSDADSLWKNLSNLPIYAGFITGKESLSTVMAISFDNKVVNDKDRLKVVQRIVDLGKEFEKENDCKIHFSGLPYIRSVISEMILREFTLFLGISIFITAFILLILYRNLYAVLFPVLIVLIGVIWSIGLMGMLGFRITLLTGIIPPLVVVIGVPNSILLLNKYRLEFAHISDKIKALKKSAETIGFTIFIANITTAIGFGVFYFTGSQILIEFGIIAFLSIMVTYLLSILLIPSVFSFLPAPKKIHQPIVETKIIHRLLTKIALLVQKRRRAIYITTLALVILGFWGLSKIRVNGYIVDDLPKSHPVYVDIKFFESEFKGVLPFEVSIDSKRKNGLRNLDLLNRIDRLEDTMKQYPIFTKAISINQLIKYGKQTFYNGNPKRFTLPTTEEAGFLANFVGKIPKDTKITSSYIDSNNQVIRVSFQMADIGSAKMNELLTSLEPKIQKIFPTKNYKVHLTGNSVLIVKGMNYLVENLFQSLALAIFLISLIMIFLFKTPKMVLISLIPNLIPLVLTAGIMGYLGINLKPTTILIFSIAFGLASDQTIYFLTKYRLDLELLKDQGAISIDNLVKRVIHETGISMIYTAIILFFGFSIFDFSRFGGTISLGILVSVTMIFAILTNILLLPAMLISIYKKKS